MKFDQDLEASKDKTNDIYKQYVLPDYVTSNEGYVNENSEK